MSDKQTEIWEKLKSLEQRIEAIEKCCATSKTTDLSSAGPDPLFSKAVEIISGCDVVSASLLQRRLSIGYARAARLLDQLEEKGFISKALGSAPRKVLKKSP